MTKSRHWNNTGGIRISSQGGLDFNNWKRFYRRQRRGEIPEVVQWQRRIWWCAIETPRFPAFDCAARWEAIDAFPMLALKRLVIQDVFPADRRWICARSFAVLQIIFGMFYSG